MTLGLESGTVRVVPYDPEWPSLFHTEASRLRAALGALLPLAMEHTGSTAVPGLAAKPILDLLGGYPPGIRIGQYVEALVEAGYVHRGEQGIPGREFFRRGEPRAYHLHLAVHDGAFWREHIAFRDALRRDSTLRDQYASLKLDLSRRFPFDRESYITGKGPFVRMIVERASHGHPIVGAAGGGGIDG